MKKIESCSVPGWAVPSSLIVVAVILLVSLLCVGCAPKFTEVPRLSVPPEKALVHVYRKAALFGDLNAEEIYVNGQLIGNLEGGEFFSYIASPGRLDFTGKPSPLHPIPLATVVNIFVPQSELLTLDVEAGKTYYVRFWFAMGAPLGPRMELAGNGTVAAEIADCRLNSWPVK